MLVAQENISGCAVACVAGYLGVSYKDALRYFEKPQRAHFEGFYCRDIVTALSRAGTKAEYKYLKPDLKRKIYHSGVIVVLARSSRHPGGHYLLRIDEGWMDPWFNFPDIRSAAQASIRKRLPGKPIYAIFTVE